MAIDRGGPHPSSNGAALWIEIYLSLTILALTAIAMDTDAPQPRCPFCGTPMRFKPSVPSFGAHSVLQTFDCRGCQVILTVPPGAGVFEMAGH